ncbi:MAG: DEAD/DEAH box helicase [Planctomycetes bacterium]|nr:DEAD/DEAH box helicase [Planctomycetota bacterium]
MRKPLIVQSDRTVFLEVDHPGYKDIRNRLMAFAELEKSPEHIHIYRITPISLWNAASARISKEEILRFLEEHSRFPVPGNIRKEINDCISQFGMIQLISGGEGKLLLVSENTAVLDEIFQQKHLSEYFAGRIDPRSIEVRPEYRGQIKLALIKLGYPVEDLAGYREGEKLPVRRAAKLSDGAPFLIRPYQLEAVDAFYAGGQASGGSGVVVLPCGAGKTIVGLGVMEKVGAHTLILTTNITALRQWRRELLEKTELTADLIGEYSGEVKKICPVTLTTYNILTYRKSKTEGFLHFNLFSSSRWGLIIYDEVHLLPAPVFRFTAELQATRRLGLTATLVREDGKEDEVFCLIGPKKFDMPWRTLEHDGFIAAASCVEIRVGLEQSRRGEYTVSSNRQKFRIASENPRKLEVVQDLLKQHPQDLVLIIGQYLDQLRILEKQIQAPLITGKTPSKDREALYEKFRRREIPVLIVSKVGNFAVDLPNANVAIQISGTFGSRQEEAQRLGRILRPKSNGGAAVFYSVVTRGTRDQDFAQKRQLFLTEQGYKYEIKEYYPSGNGIGLSAGGEGA